MTSLKCPDTLQGPESTTKPSVTPSESADCIKNAVGPILEPYPGLRLVGHLFPSRLPGLVACYVGPQIPLQLYQVNQMLGGKSGLQKIQQSRTGIPQRHL